LPKFVQPTFFQKGSLAQGFEKKSGNRKKLSFTKYERGETENSGNGKKVALSKKYI
jgi:hypothetical protein